MVRTCSEDAKVALNHVANQAKHGSSPVHTIEASWPMQRCLVRAVLPGNVNSSSGTVHASSLP